MVQKAPWSVKLTAKIKFRHHSLNNFATYPPLRCPILDQLARDLTNLISYKVATDKKWHWTHASLHPQLTQLLLVLAFGRLQIMAHQVKVPLMDVGRRGEGREFPARGTLTHPPRFPGWKSY